MATGGQDESDIYQAGPSPGKSSDDPVDYNEETDRNPQPSQVFQWEDPKHQIKYTIKPHRPLLELILYGNYKALKSFLEKHTTGLSDEAWCEMVEIKDTQHGVRQVLTQLNAIHLAVLLHEKELLDLLLHHDLKKYKDEPFSNYDRKDSSSKVTVQEGNALHLAICGSLLEIAHMLLANQCDINAPCGQVIISDLFRKSIYVWSKPTPVILAVSFVQDVSLLAALMDFKPDMCCLSTSYTAEMKEESFLLQPARPLHLATVMKKPAVVRFLLAKNGHSQDAVHFVKEIETSDSKITATLMEMSALHIAVFLRSVEIAEILLEDMDGENHLAVIQTKQNGLLTIIKGVTPLHVAIFVDDEKLTSSVKGHLPHLISFPLEQLTQLSFGNKCKMDIRYIIPLNFAMLLTETNQLAIIKVLLKDSDLKNELCEIHQLPWLTEKKSKNCLPVVVTPLELGIIWGDDIITKNLEMASLEKDLQKYELKENIRSLIRDEISVVSSLTSELEESLQKCGSGSDILGTLLEEEGSKPIGPEAIQQEQKVVNNDVSGSTETEKQKVKQHEQKGIDGVSGGVKKLKDALVEVILPYVMQHLIRDPPEILTLVYYKGGRIHAGFNTESKRGAGAFIHECIRGFTKKIPQIARIAEIFINNIHIIEGIVEVEPLAGNEYFLGKGSQVRAIDPTTIEGTFEATSFSDLKKQWEKRFKFGSVGCFAKEKGGAKCFALTAQHVLNDESDGNPYRRHILSVVQGEKIEEVIMLSNHSQGILEQRGTTLMDIAIMELSYNLSNVLTIGDQFQTPLTVGLPEAGLLVEKIGAKTGHTHGKVERMEAYINNTELKVAGDVFTVVNEPKEPDFAEQGDSGALIFKREGKRLVAVGILHGILKMKETEEEEKEEKTEETEEEKEEKTEEKWYVCMKIADCLRYLMEDYDIELELYDDVKIEKPDSHSWLSMEDKLQG